MFDLIGGILGGLGGLFGGKKKQNESFERITKTESEATATDLSPELLKELESLFMSTLGSGQFEQTGSALSSRLQQLMGRAGEDQFDVAGFAKGITDQAVAGAGLDLESSINGMMSASGSSIAGNSMGTLLANKLRNQTAANLSGIAAQATATGEGIRQAQQQGLTEGIMGLSGALSGQIMDLIKSTRGARNHGTAKSKEHTKGKGTISESGGSNPFSFFGDLLGSFGDAQEDA